MKVNRYFNQVFNSDNKWILVILCGAFLVRFIGIAYGYPYIFNIDEPALVRSTRGLFFNSYIGHFDWPHFNYYFNFIIFWLFIKFRAVLQILHMRPILERFIPSMFNDPFSFYVLIRFTNAVLGMLTVFGVYKLSYMMFENTIKNKRKVGKTVALASAFGMSFLPYHVYISHVAIQETALLFWTTWSLYFGYKFSLDRGYKDLIISAMFLAFASGVKYNAFLMGVYIVFFIVINFDKFNHVVDRKIKLSQKSAVISSLKVLLIYSVTYLVTFFITNYQIIKNFKTFWSYEPGRGFLWQLKINSSPITTLTDFINSVRAQTVSLIVDTGFVPIFLILIGVIFVSFRILKGYKNANIESHNSFHKNLRGSIENVISTNDLIIISGIILLTILGLLFVMHYQRANSHYYVIYYWAIAILSGYFSVYIFNENWIIYIVLMPLLIFSLKYDYLFLRQSTFNLALECYERNKENNNVWFNGPSLSEVQIINNLKMRRFKSLDKVERDNIVITEVKLDDNSLHLLKIIDNENKFGPKIYVYVKY